MIRPNAFVLIELLPIPISALFFALLHVLTTQFLDFAEISPNVNLIYLPSLLRLLNVLLLGNFRGTLATALGGILVMQGLNGFTLIGFMNVACSVSGPLLALWLFERFKGRPVGLTSLKDLVGVTVVYCVANAGVHHLVWSFFDPLQQDSLGMIFWMMLGDLNGALIGAYALKWTASRFQHLSGRRGSGPP